MSVCRMCLNSNMKMHDVRDNQLVQAYEQLAKVKLHNVSGPQTVCYICHALLWRYSNISQMAHRSEEILADLKERGVEVTQESIGSTVSAKHNVIKLSAATQSITNHYVDTSYQPVEETHVRIKQEVQDFNTNQDLSFGSANDTVHSQNADSNDGYRSRIVFEDNKPLDVKVLMQEKIQEKQPISCSHGNKDVKLESEIKPNNAEKIIYVDMVEIKEEDVPDRCKTRIVFESDNAFDHQKKNMPENPETVLEKENVPNNSKTLLSQATKDIDRSEIAQDITKRALDVILEETDTGCQGLTNLPTREKIHTCKDCDRNFESRREFVSHIRSNKLKPCSCHKCGKRLESGYKHVCELTHSQPTGFLAPGNVLNKHIVLKQCKNCGKPKKSSLMCPDITRNPHTEFVRPFSPDARPSTSAEPNIVKHHSGDNPEKRKKLKSGRHHKFLADHNYCV